MWLSKNKGCPLCRQPMNINNLIVVTDKETKETKNELMDKIDHIRDILTNKINKDSKVLIFSEYSNTFNGISELLDEKNIKYSRLLGSGTSISSKVESFKSKRSSHVKKFEEEAKIEVIEAKHWFKPGFSIFFQNISEKNPK